MSPVIQPPAPVDLGAKMQFELEFSQQIIRDGGEVAPRWVAHTAHDGSIVLITPWDSEEAKVRVLTMLRMAFAVCDVTSYTFSGEVWVARVKDKSELAGLTPSQHPERIEAVSVIAVDQHGPMHVMAEIIRDPHGVRFGPLEGMGEHIRGEGRICSLLPQPDDPQLPEKLKAALKAEFMAMMTPA